MGRDPHAQRERAAGGLAGDGPEPDEAEALARDLAAHQGVARPGSGRHGVGGAVGPTQEQHRGADDVFGHRDIVGARRGIDRDAARLTSRKIDVVEADPEAPDYLEVGSGGEERRPHLGAVADHEGVGVAEGRHQVARPVDEARIVDRREPGEFGRDGLLVHEFADHHLGAAGR